MYYTSSIEALKYDSDVREIVKTESCLVTSEQLLAPEGNVHEVARKLSRFFLDLDLTVSVAVSRFSQQLWFDSRHCLLYYL